MGRKSGRLIGRSQGFVIGAAVVLAVAWAVMWVVPRVSLAGYNPDPVKPGTVNLIAVQREAGYRIVVSNSIAHLVELTGNEAFDAPDMDRDSTQDAARLPIRETLKALAGDVDALGHLVMSVNKIREDEFPPSPAVWRAEDIQRAIDGDMGLRQSLERDLNTGLDGKPLDTVSISAIINGIVIDAPVTVVVPIEGKPTSLVCRVREPFQTLFAGAVESKINDRFNLSKEMLIGHYRELAKKELEKPAPDDVAGALKSRISPSRLKFLAEVPERILANIKALVNENQMSGATLDTYDGPNRTILSDVTLKLTKDGTMRLWKYSHDNPGFQLLLTVNGIAIAAPRITTELSGSEVVVKGVPGGEQVKEAVTFINKAAEGSNKR